MFYGFLADALALVHLGYVGFVVVGEVLILLGAAMRWRWVRNPWFRAAHLLAIAIVAMEAVFHMTCPLTSWEWQLRAAAGQPNLHESFVGRIVQTLFLSTQWKPEVYEHLHLAFGALVLLTYVFVPPRFRRSSSSQRAVCA